MATVKKKKVYKPIRCWTIPVLGFLWTCPVWEYVNGELLHRACAAHKLVYGICWTLRHYGHILISAGEAEAARRASLTRFPINSCWCDLAEAITFHFSISPIWAQGNTPEEGWWMHVSSTSDFNVLGERYINGMLWTHYRHFGLLNIDTYNNFRMNIFVIYLTWTFQV